MDGTMVCEGLRGKSKVKPKRKSFNFLLGRGREWEERTEKESFKVFWSVVGVIR